MPATAHYRTGGPTPAVGRAVLDEIVRLVKQGFYSTHWRQSFGASTRVTDLRVDDEAHTATIVSDRGESVIERFIELTLWPETIGHQQGRIIVIGNNATGDGYIGQLELLPPDRFDDAERCTQFEAALDEARTRIDVMAEIELATKRAFAEAMAAALVSKNWVRVDSGSDDRIVLNGARRVEIAFTVRIDGIDIDLREDPANPDPESAHGYLQRTSAVLDHAIVTAAFNTFNMKFFG